MKFAASVLVVLAVAATSNAAATFGYNGYPYPGFYGYNGYPYTAGFAAPYFPAPQPAFAFNPDAEFIPAADAAAAAFPAAPFSGNYVAANRGTVHVAPLEGHTQSVRTFNTDPAPGTY